MTKDTWLAKHPYLRGMADLQKFIDATLAEVFIPIAGVPTWNTYIDDFRAGVPLLQSSLVTTDFRSLETPLTSVVETLASKPLPEQLASETKNLIAEVLSDSVSVQRALAWLLKADKDTFCPRHPGLLLYLGWTVIARHLYQVVEAFNNWRDEERWLRNYCPMCGAPPAMGQLVRKDLASFRLLSCGYCATRWHYRRTGCPFCEATDAHRSEVVTIEGDDALQIEYCANCSGYLKTYNGEGREELLLADWTSLHLDIIAQDRGLKRYAGSLYQF